MAHRKRGARVLSRYSGVRCACVRMHTMPALRSKQPQQRFRCCDRDRSPCGARAPHLPIWTCVQGVAMQFSLSSCGKHSRTSAFVMLSWARAWLCVAMTALSRDHGREIESTEGFGNGAQTWHARITANSEVAEPLPKGCPTVAQQVPRELSVGRMSASSGRCGPGTRSILALEPRSNQARPNFVGRCCSKLSQLRRTSALRRTSVSVG